MAIERAVLPERVVYPDLRYARDKSCHPNTVALAEARPRYQAARFRLC